MNRDWIQDLFKTFRTYQFHANDAWRAQYLDNVRSRGIFHVLAELSEYLSNPDPELRCAAVEAMLYLDAPRSLERILPLLDDPVVVVRWAICELLSQFGDERALAGLITRLQSDPDAQVRNTAAYALGTLRSPTVLPALLLAEQNDHEEDSQGHSASSVAKGAINDFLIRLVIDYLARHNDAVIDLQLLDNLRLTGAIAPLHYPGQQMVPPPVSRDDVEQSRHQYKWMGRPDWVPYHGLSWDAYGPSVVGLDVQTVHQPPFEVVVSLRHAERVVKRMFIFGYDGEDWIISTLYYWST